MLGSWLEFGVATSDVVASLSFYKSLGFREIPSGDVWPHKYAVVSDGDITIGLHDRTFDAPALTFVQQDIARHARSMSDHGYDFSFLKIDDDVFNELGFSDRDGHTISMLEARTFSPVPDDIDDSVCGRWIELTLPVKDVVQAGFFWAPLAPAVIDLREEPTMHMRFDAGGMAIGLSESIALDAPGLCFKCPDRGALEAALERLGLEPELYPGFEGAFCKLLAPEGTALYLFTEDFLGEAYEVSENVAADA